MSRTASNYHILQTTRTMEDVVALTPERNRALNLDRLSSDQFDYKLDGERITTSRLEEIHSLFVPVPIRGKTAHYLNFFVRDVVLLKTVETLSFVMVPRARISELVSLRQHTITRLVEEGKLTQRSF